MIYKTTQRNKGIKNSNFGIVDTFGKELKKAIQEKKLGFQLCLIFIVGWQMSTQIFILL